MNNYAMIELPIDFSIPVAKENKDDREETTDILEQHEIKLGE